MSRSVADRIGAEDIRVVSATGFTAIIINDTSSSGTAMLRMISADYVFQCFPSSTMAVIQTNQANRIRLRTDNANSTINGITIQTDNSVAFESSIDVAGALSVQGRDVLNDIDGKQTTFSSLDGTGDADQRCLYSETHLRRGRRHGGHPSLRC
jgi:hypothetical protein